jgi:hypothetical protein
MVPEPIAGSQANAGFDPPRRHSRASDADGEASR